MLWNSDGTDRKRKAAQRRSAGRLQLLRTNRLRHKWQKPIWVLRTPSQAEQQMEALERTPGLDELRPYWRHLSEIHVASRMALARALFRTSSSTNDRRAGA
jgi:hypothetical protein